METIPAGPLTLNRGDLVHVAKDLGPAMSHFPSDRDAVVIGSYADLYGGTNRDDFSLYLRGEGSVSWYYAKQLTLIEAGRADLLEEWTAEVQAERAKREDLDWIFSHGAEVLEGAHGATTEALARCLGINNLWGSHGEGFVYYRNASIVFALAEPYLRDGDKSGWLAYSAAVRNERLGGRG